MSGLFPADLDPVHARERYARYDFVQTSERAHRHRLVLPRGMRPVPGAAPARPAAWSPVVVLADEARELTVGVRAMRLDREVTPGAVLMLALRALECVVVATEPIDRPAGGASIDVLTRSADGRWVSRWTALKWGSDRGATILVVEARVPAERFSRRAADLFVAVRGFELLDPSLFPFAEKMRKHNRGTPGDFAFFYPESWAISDDPINEELRIVQLTSDHQGSPIGAIVFECAAGQRPDHLATEYLVTLQTHGIRLQMERATEAPPSGGLTHTFAQRGLGRTEGSSTDDVRVRVFGGTCGSTGYVIASAGPSYESKPVAAEIMARAHDLVIATLRTLPV